MKKAKEIKLRPRLAVFRSNRYIAAQIIDDGKGKTLVAANEKELETNRKRESQKKKGDTEEKPLSKTEKARLVGELLAQKALKVGLKEVKFDRRSYRYHGRVQALAEGARKGGLNF